MTKHGVQRTTSPYGLLFSPFSHRIRFPLHSCNKILFVVLVTKANASLVLFVSFFLVVYLFVKTKQHFMHNQTVSHLSLRNGIFKWACDIIGQLAAPPNNAVTARMNKSLHCCIMKALLHKHSPITCNAILNKGRILCVCALWPHFVCVVTTLHQVPASSMWLTTNQFP